MNAKQHEREAEIVAQAGMFDKVTIATNMAGRGTDILLGGNPDFMAKHDMKKQGYGDYVIESLDSFLPSTDEELVAARNVYNELHKKYKKMTDENKKKFLKSADYILSVRNVTNHVVSTTNCVVVLAVKVTLVDQDFSYHWETT